MRASGLALVAFLAAQNCFSLNLDCILALTDRTEISNENISANSFKTNRSLDHYSSQIPFIRTSTIFRIVTRELNSGSAWVDMGAGKGLALIDGLFVNKNISLGLGISYKRPEEPITEKEIQLGERMQYLDGDYLENLVRDKKLDHLFGKVDLITDIYGPISYSESLPILLQTYMNLLKVDGQLIFNWMIKRNYILVNNKIEYTNSPILVNTVNSGESVQENGILSWLESIPGIEIVESAVREIASSSREYSIGVKIRKKVQDVNIPNNLVLTSYAAGGPPARNFQIQPDETK